MTLIPVGLDMGSSEIKCMTRDHKVCFPSVITTLKSNVWDDKSSKNMTIGANAVKTGKAYNAKCVFPIASGRPIDINGYTLLAEHALQNIGIVAENVSAPANPQSQNATIDLSQICLVVGLPYDATPQIQNIQAIFNSKLKVGKCIIETQARGTLRSMQLKTGIIFNIGFGTTESVIFDDNRAVEGASLRCAINTILEGLAASDSNIDKTSLTDIGMFDQYEKESAPFAEEIADEINRWYQEKMLRAKHEYPVIISGGGVLNKAVIRELKKTDIKFSIPDEPLYSNVKGHFMRAEAAC